MARALAQKTVSHGEPIRVLAALISKVHNTVQTYNMTARQHIFRSSSKTYKTCIDISLYIQPYLSMAAHCFLMYRNNVTACTFKFCMQQAQVVQNKICVRKIYVYTELSACTLIQSCEDISYMKFYWRTVAVSSIIIPGKWKKK